MLVKHSQALDRKSNELCNEILDNASQGRDAPELSASPFFDASGVGDRPWEQYGMSEEEWLDAVDGHAPQD